MKSKPKAGSKAPGFRIKLADPNTVLLQEAMALLWRCLNWYEIGGTMPSSATITGFLCRAERGLERNP